MNRVLVDSSVWISYFRGQTDGRRVNELLDAGVVVTNDLVRAELIPAMRSRSESRLEDLFDQIPRLPLDIDWSGIIAMQTDNLEKGWNGVGIPDLIIAQNAIVGDAILYSLDRHFLRMRERFGLRLLEPEDLGGDSL